MAINNQQLSLTVGIPTYYGAPAMIKTIESILASKNVEPFRLIVTVDGNPLKPEVEQRLKQLGVEIIFNPQRGGQTARIKQLISLCQTEILILTQDDVLFTPDAMAEILNIFKQEATTTMIGARIKPVKAETWFESIIEVGVKINYHIGKVWNGGDNYLLAIGRCLAFRADHIKKFNIDEAIINSDAYLYFENKNHGGQFRHAKTAVVFNKSPQKLKEHLKQSRRFFNSKDELDKYVTSNLTSEYQLPRRLVLRAYWRQIITQPIKSIIYVAIELYSILGRKNTAMYKKFWETDVSTKR